MSVSSALGEGREVARPRALTITGLVLASLAALIGVLDWIGWLLGDLDLTRLRPDWPRMVPWTALWIGMLAVAGALQMVGGRRAHRIAYLLAAVVMVSGLIVGFEFLSGRNAGIDLIWVREHVEREGMVYPGRPSPQTVLSAVPLAILILLLRRDGSWANRLRLAATVLAGGAPLMVATAYLFNAPAIVGITHATGMAFSTALCLLAILLELVIAAPDRPPLSTLLNAADNLPALQMLGAIFAFPLVARIISALVSAIGVSGQPAVTLGILTATLLVSLLAYRISMTQRRTLRKEQELSAALAASEERYRLLAENSSDVVLRLSLDGVIEWASPSTVRSYGWPPELLVGQRTFDLIHADDQPWYRAELERVVISGATSRFPVRIRHLDGEYTWAEAVGQVVAATDSRQAFRVVRIRDIDAEVRARTELERLAQFDTLTGLVNRREALRRMDEVTGDARVPGLAMAVLFCDIDRFKTINDGFGHAAGDEVLRSMARRISEAVRASDVVARTGGDELLVMLFDIHNLEEAVEIAEKIRVAAAQPITFEGAVLQASLSIGVAMTMVGESTDALIARADRAMYVAKARGRDQVVAVGAEPTQPSQHPSAVGSAD
ncbi:MAG: diguanylate cyclase [Candidatus Nanopelagicales bacterium]